MIPFQLRLNFCYTLEMPFKNVALNILLALVRFVGSTVKSTRAEDITAQLDETWDNVPSKSLFSTHLL